MSEIDEEAMASVTARLVDPWHKTFARQAIEAYEAAKQPVQPDEETEVDAFCITRDFEEWANLSPVLHLGKDGDDEYEDIDTKRYYACFEYAYRKGMWGAARHINGELCDENARLLMRESGEQGFTGKKSVEQDGE